MKGCRARKDQDGQHGGGAEGSRAKGRAAGQRGWESKGQGREPLPVQRGGGE